MEKIYAKGLYWNEKRDNAPDFVLGSISIKLDDLKELERQILEHWNNGYCRFQVLQGKEKPYVVVDTYKPKEKKEITLEDVSF